jgi:predicted acylesterase/phospholipase RssA
MKGRLSGVREKLVESCRTSTGRSAELLVQVEADRTRSRGGTRMPQLGLALSGGGLRATLFHLGIVRFLRDAGLLRDITDIVSVSCGSIFATGHDQPVDACSDILQGRAGRLEKQNFEWDHRFL